MNADIDVSETVLNTDRLTLRPWRESDLADFFEYASVDGVGQMAGWTPHKDIEESRAIMSRFIDHKSTFALEHQGKVIGSLGIEEYSEEQFPEFADKKVREIGYVLSKEYWGQGLMPEAVKEVIRYLFEEVGLDLVLCAHFLSNSRSEGCRRSADSGTIPTGPMRPNSALWKTTRPTFSQEKSGSLRGDRFVLPRIADRGDTYS